MSLLIISFVYVNIHRIKKNIEKRFLKFIVRILKKKYDRTNNVCTWRQATHLSIAL